MIGVELDTLGRLIRFEAVPSSGPQASSTTLDWSILLAEAGLDAAAFSPAEPQWLPPSYADARAAWVESKPERPDRPLRIEAADLRDCSLLRARRTVTARPDGRRPAELSSSRDFPLPLSAYWSSAGR